MTTIKSAFTLLLLLSFVQAFPQFTITDNFSGSNIDNRIVLGGSPSSTLTSGVSDPVNNGWLRLTTATGNQKGYAYVKNSFPSTLGVLIDFEYKTWRSTSDGSYGGADGFCVFLFDGSATFATGGYGGSLGYAPNTVSSPAVNTGMAGGYVGIGFDEYGNFSNPTEGRNGGPGLTTNGVVVRGPTTGSTTTTNAYLTGTAVSAVDYDVLTPTRPTDAQFYRRVQIEIIPAGSSYTITVRWKTSTAGTFTQLMSYTLPTLPPAFLKMGFIASTGGGFNYHEIRNLSITTPGNVRVDKNVDKPVVNAPSQLTYNVNLTNSTPAALTGILLADTLKDGNGNALTSSDFTLNSITFNDNGNTGNTANGFTSGTAHTTGLTNPFNATVNLAANSSANFTIVGTVNTVPAGGIVKNAVKIDPTPTGITDLDTTNNNYTVSTNVLSSNVDFVINKTLDSYCADPTNGNAYALTVLNNGATASSGARTVTVTDVIPTGFTVVSAAGTGWTASHTGLTYTFTRGDALASGFSYPPILIQVKPPTIIGASWVNTATVAYSGTESNITNNSSSITLYSKPAAPPAVTPVLYCPGDIALPLTATGTSLTWYMTNTGSVGSTTAPTPVTTTAGSTTWYVSQSNGSCESPLSSIVVTVRPNATLTLTSAPGTTNQTVAPGVAITPIVYTVGGAATGASAAGFPIGISGVYSAGLFTISGSSILAGSYPYLVTTIGGSCLTGSVNGAINIGVALPVTLVDFTGIADQGKVRLDWTTDLEVNNAGFEIFRSTDGAGWTSIGSVPDAAVNGYSSLPLSYTFYDNNPLTGNNYYRLKQTDRDGKAVYSRSLLVSFEGGDKIIVSPNPASTQINVQGVSAGQVLRLVDLQGRTLQEKIVTGDHMDLQIGQMAEGSYILQVINKGKVIRTVKLLRSH